MYFVAILGWKTLNSNLEITEIMQSLSFFGKFCRGFALEMKMPEKIPEKYEWSKLIVNLTNYDQLVTINVKFQNYKNDF